MLKCTRWLLLFFAGGAWGADAWLLMERHGDCVEIAQLGRRVPELADAPDPYALVKLMQQKGYAASAQEMTASGGKAVEVRVPARNLAMVFVTRELCEKLSAKP
jgi:hypothetical protein